MRGRTLLILMSSLILAAATPVSAVAGGGGTDRPFKGSGSAVSTFNFGTNPIPATDVGTAHFSHLGASTYTLDYTVAFSSATAFTVTGTGTVVAANGDMLFATLTGTGTLGGVFGIGQTTETAVAWVTTGGTGRFADASGTMVGPASSVVRSIVGTIGTSSQTFTVEGTISY
jgi:hypothetical protein